MSCTLPCRVRTSSCITSLMSREYLPEAHGTAVVSLLVSPQFGMLPGAQLYVACVFYEDRRGGSLSEAQDLVRALDWLMERRVPVINMSLSGPPNEVLRAAIKRAVRRRSPDRRSSRQRRARFATTLSRRLRGRDRGYCGGWRAARVPARQPRCAR